MRLAASASSSARVKERRSFNATDVAIAAEIQQELDTVRRMAASAPVLATQLPPEITFADAEPEAAEEDRGELGSRRRSRDRETEAPQVAEEEAKAEVVAEAASVEPTEATRRSRDQRPEAERDVGTASP